MKKTFLKIVGYLSVALGFAGAFLPLVPTTPLLLLALWCFSRSSPKMNAWLLGNRMFGRYLKDYEQGRGIPKVVKVSSVIILWSSILFTTIVFTEAWWLRALLLLMALLVSVHILNLKTLLTGSKILVLIPTAMEGEKFAANLPPLVATFLFAFLSIRVEDASILDFLRYAVNFLFLKQQYYEWGEAVE